MLDIQSDLCYTILKVLNDTSLPPGKELSVRLSIVRPLEIESSGAIFLFRSGVMEKKTGFREFFRYTDLEAEKRQNPFCC